MMTFRNLLLGLGMALLLGASAHGYSFERTKAHEACAQHISVLERAKGIPRHLLSAISKVESGRTDQLSGKFVAWPWTLNVEGQGYTYPTKEAAIAAVRKFHRQGKKSIDVGCMQVNLLHHPQAFRSLDEALDPRKNIDYASRFLSDLKNAHGSWTKAVAHYHSATRELHLPYRKKVYDIWNKERLKGEIGLEAPSESYEDAPPLPGRSKARLISIPKIYPVGGGSKGPRIKRPSQDAHAHMALYRERAQNALRTRSTDERSPPHMIKIVSRTPSTRSYNALRLQARSLQKKLETPTFIQG